MEGEREGNWNIFHVREKGGGEEGREEGESVRRNDREGEKERKGWRDGKEEEEGKEDLAKDIRRWI